VSEYGHINVPNDDIVMENLWLLGGMLRYLFKSDRCYVQSLKSTTIEKLNATTCLDLFIMFYEDDYNFYIYSFGFCSLIFKI
jgi:hypothetical protein